LRTCFNNSSRRTVVGSRLERAIEANPYHYLVSARAALAPAGFPGAATRAVQAHRAGFRHAADPPGVQWRKFCVHPGIRLVRVLRTTGSRSGGLSCAASSSRRTEKCSFSYRSHPATPVRHDK
jgi:hypothetical protein